MRPEVPRDEEHGLLVTILDRAPVVGTGERGWWVDGGEAIADALVKVTLGDNLTDEGEGWTYGWCLVGPVSRYAEDGDQSVTVIVEALGD